VDTGALSYPNVTRMVADFHDPPWSAPLDVAACLAAIPDDATVKGLFLLPMVAEAQRLGVVLPGARERYLPFSDYPLTEHATLLVEAARVLFPDASMREGLRKLGRAAQRAFRETTIGKVIWSTAEHLHGALDSVAKGYALTSFPSRVAVVEKGPGVAHVRFEEVHYFIDSHHVGIFEGVMRACGVRGSVRVRLDSPSSGEFLLTWASD